MKHATSHSTHGYHPNRSTLILALAFVAAFVVKGCIPQPYYANPQPINMANNGGAQNQQATTVTYANPPTAGVPYGGMVVTRNGYVIPRMPPVPSRFFGASPAAAQMRAEGEAIANSDYAGVAAAAPQVPSSQGRPGTATSGQQGGASPDDTSVLAGELAHQNERIGNVEDEVQRMRRRNRR